MNILYIDDDPEDIEVFREALISADPGSILHTASDGVDAFRTLGNLEVLPDLIFLDVNMPRMNGREFLHRIKQTVGLSRIPVIMYSTTSQKNEIEALKKAGAYDFIVKSNNFEKLHTILKGLLIQAHSFALKPTTTKEINTMKCLLIDDDQEDQEIFSMALKDVDSAIEFHLATSGFEAISKLKQYPQFCPQIIFIDINMPKMNGITCLKEIRQLPGMTDTEIFMYSTTIDPFIAQVSAELGAKVMIKPANISALISQLSEILHMAEK